MSVYIKGMEMPDKCGHCRFASAFDCGVTGNFISTHSIRQPDCPLVPVPEHGRLIDADALGISLEKLAADKWNQKAAPINWSYAFEECLEMVDNATTIIEQNFISAPTIIPADKEGEG